MTRRVLHRPPHGWASTPVERAADRLSAWVPLAVLFCFAAAIGMSAFASTVSLINALSN